MGKKENKVDISNLLRRLTQRSGAKCESHKLGLACPSGLTETSEPLVHHLDGNPRNNEIKNLILLCPNCHSKIIERLSEKRRKTYVQKVAEELDKSFLGKRHS